MPPSAEPLLDSASASSTARGGVELDWLTQKVRCVRGSVSRRAMRASGDSPSHLSAKHHLLATYLRLMVSFRGMLLTLQSGLERLTPQAHRVPVYPKVFPHSDMSLHGARSGRCRQSGAVLCSARPIFLFSVIALIDGQWFVFCLPYFIRMPGGPKILGLLDHPQLGTHLEKSVQMLGLYPLLVG